MSKTKHETTRTQAEQENKLIYQNSKKLKQGEQYLKAKICKTTKAKLAELC